MAAMGCTASLCSSQLPTVSASHNASLTDSLLQAHFCAFAKHASAEGWKEQRKLKGENYLHLPISCPTLATGGRILAIAMPSPAFPRALSATFVSKNPRVIFRPFKKQELRKQPSWIFLNLNLTLDCGSSQLEQGMGAGHFPISARPPPRSQSKCFPVSATSRGLRSMRISVALIRPGNRCSISSKRS